MNPITMPPRNTTAEVVAVASSKLMKLACTRFYPLVHISDIATVVSGGTPNTGNPDYWDGEIIWVTPKDLGRPRNIEVFGSDRKITQAGGDSSSARILPVGTILLSSRAPIGHLGIAAVPLCTNQGFKNLICGPEIDNRFLFHVLRGSVSDLQAEGRGNTFAEIPARIVENYQIPLPLPSIQKAVAAFLDALYQRLAGQRSPLPDLPEPLSNQRRIVARIEELAAKIEQANALRQQASAETATVMKSVMLHIFRPSAQHPEVPLDSVCADIIDNLHSNPVYSDDGVPCVRSPDVGWGKLRLATALKTSEEEYVRRTVRGEPRTDDIVLVREGGGTGKAAIVEEGQRFSLGQRVMLLRPDSDRVLPKFFLHQLLSPAIYEEQILTLLKGSASPHLNIGALRKFRFYLPSLSEQQRMVNYLDDLEVKMEPLARLQAETAAELDALLPSILDKAFMGEF
jgi:type I restriction enzyme S subunit